MSRIYLDRMCAALGLSLFLTQASLAQEAARPEFPGKEELMLLLATAQVLEESFVKPMSRPELLRAAIRGMVREIDPSGGEFWSKEEFQNFTRGYTGGSIGLELTERDGSVVVVSPIVDGPADKGGLKPNDVLRAIDGVDLVRGDLSKAVRLLRGDVGSTVRLTIRRPPEFQPLELSLVRSRVNQTSVILAQPSEGVAVLRITRMIGSTLTEVAARLGEIRNPQALRGMVLDLRRNSGGTLQESVGLAALFLPRDVVIAYSQGRTSESNQVIRADPSFYATRGRDPFAGIPAELRALPLAVLVDEGTASGAEIVAGALRDHGRARLVGRKTFGRASLQTVIPIQDGGVKFTSGYWQTPLREDIDRKGITPERLVTDTDPQAELKAAIDELSTLY